MASSPRDQLYLAGDGERTFEHDQRLPSLPLPSLRDTLRRYLESVRHLVHAQDWQHTAQLVERFEANDGRRLQAILEQKAGREKNWLEQWWLEYAYLRGRQPLIPYSNMSAPMPVADYWPPTSDPTQVIYRASLVIHVQLQFWRMLRAERMKPMIHKDVPWSMEQFRKLFNTCRIPQADVDRVEHHFRTRAESASVPTNVIVLHRGHIFSISTLHPGPDEQIYSLSQLSEQLSAIVADPRCERPGAAVATLTAQTRERWAADREGLLRASAANREHLQLIERALFCVCLDPAQPQTPTEMMRQSICGDPSNRWADKSLSSIYFANGVSGASCDHTPFDGFATALMTHYLICSMDECKGRWPAELVQHEDRRLAGSVRDQVRPLEFTLDSALTQQIQKAGEQYRRNCDRIDVLTSRFDGYGKGLIKRARIHPEALVQVALQLAYHRVRQVRPALHEAAPTCYCTASTRVFHNGRTETVRSCSEEATEFALETIRDRNFSPQHLALLRKAAQKFQQLMSEAMQGQGIDRHFLGLYIASLENGVDLPEIFLDPTFAASGSGGNYVLSTSCSGYWNLTGGVPPMREDGYGVFYGIEEERLHFTMISYKDNPATDLRLYFDEICNALRDIEQIFQKAKL